MPKVTQEVFVAAVRRECGSSIADDLERTLRAQEGQEHPQTSSELGWFIRTLVEVSVQRQPPPTAHRTQKEFVPLPLPQTDFPLDRRAL